MEYESYLTGAQWNRNDSQIEGNGGRQTIKSQTEERAGENVRTIRDRNGDGVGDGEVGD